MASALELRPDCRPSIRAHCGGCSTRRSAAPRWPRGPRVSRLERQAAGIPRTEHCGRGQQAATRIERGYPSPRAASTDRSLGSETRTRRQTWAARGIPPARSLARWGSPEAPEPRRCHACSPCSVAESRRSGEHRVLVVSAINQEDLGSASIARRIRTKYFVPHLTSAKPCHPSSLTVLRTFSVIAQFPRFHVEPPTPVSNILA